MKAFTCNVQLRSTLGIKDTSKGVMSLGLDLSKINQTNGSEQMENEGRDISGDTMWKCLGKQRAKAKMMEKSCGFNRRY